MDSRRIGPIMLNALRSSDVFLGVVLALSPLSYSLGMPKEAKKLWGLKCIHLAFMLFANDLLTNKCCIK